MERVFGLPAGTLAVALAVGVGVAVAILTALALRNIVLVKLGLRNIVRRRARTTLIVVGLMLATTIIATALGTGDTMSATIRASVFERLGATDEIVAIKGSDVGSAYGGPGGVVAAEGASGAGTDYFDESYATTIAAATATSTLVDGIAPAIIETIAVQNRSRGATEPRVTLFASASKDRSAFGAIRGSDGSSVSLNDLAGGEVFLNEDAAEDLRARRGDLLTLFAGRRTSQVVVRDVVAYRGAGTASAAVLLGLPAAQELLGQPGRIRYVLVSNTGDAESGLRHTDAVQDLLEPTLAPLGLAADPIKRDGLEFADQTGNTFMQMFTTFGSFSIVAGVLLIFLIFVMLATERRGEMGVARAVGTQRGHLVQTFLFEGAAYDAVAAGIGAALGLAVSLAMVTAVGSLLATTGIEITFDVQPRSFVIAYCLGLLLTLIVVAVSAWRVSVLNIVTAIRNLPDPLVTSGRRASWGRAALTIGAGVFFIMSGRQSLHAMPLGLGVSLVFIGLVPVARLAGLSDRVAYTIAGVALVVWWLLPFRVLDSLVPGLKMDFSVWVVGGLLVVLGATWTLIHNADALLGVTALAFSRVRSMTPVLRISMAYPLRNRLRTGMTLAMFTLVVFTVVVGATTSRAFIRAFDNVENFSGGFDIRASVAPTGAVPDLGAALATTRGLPTEDVRVVASQSTVGVEARQAGTGREFVDYPLRGLDHAFLDHNGYQFGARARGYATAADVWRALDTTPGLAVVDALVAPRRQNWTFGPRPEFVLSGFWLEDGEFDPVPIDVRDPQTGRMTRVTIIGVVRSDAPLEMAGLLTSQRTLAPFGARAIPTVYYVDLADGADPAAFADQLEAAFLANGVQAETFQKVLDEMVGGSLTFNWLILGFMGLGLVVGVAALGVISARAVVERRQQIGVLRAIGFQSRMIQVGFLTESAFISLTSILVGSALGLVMAYNVVSDAARQADWATVQFHVPWAILSLVFAAVFLAALATTYLPARRGSRVYAAEALRYQ